MKHHARNIFEVPVGLPKKGIRAILCKAGYAKLLEYRAKPQFRKAERTAVRGNSLYDHLSIKQTPYIFARYRDTATGREKRHELGRWLLDSRLPVAHVNGNLLDFRLKNLVAQETTKQKAVHVRAALKRAQREERSARWAAKRAGDHARRPEKGPDGLTPEQKEGELCSPEFQMLLKRLAGSYVKDHMQPGTVALPADEMRAPEIVAQVTAGAIRRLRQGKIRNIRAWAYYAVRTQAEKARKRIWAKLGHVTRPRLETRTLSDLETKQ